MSDRYSHDHEWVDDDAPCITVEERSAQGDPTGVHTLTWIEAEQRLSEHLRELVAQVALSGVTLYLIDGTSRTYRRAT